MPPHWFCITLHYWTSEYDKFTQKERKIDMGVYSERG